METVASTAMDRYVELVQQYSGQQQVDLAVEIQVPSSWFGVGPMGSLTTTELRNKYNDQAVEYCEVREFPGATKGARSWSRLLARRGLPLQDQRVLLRSSLGPWQACGFIDGGNRRCGQEGASERSLTR